MMLRVLIQAVLILIILHSTDGQFSNSSSDINNCSPNPCLNNGNCSDLVDDYHCTCAAGYAGKNCSTCTVGVRVYGRWTNELYYEGVIDNETVDTLHIQFDDGDQVWHQRADFKAVVLDKIPRQNAIVTGTKVIAFWPKRVKFYSGVVKQIDLSKPGGNYFIQYDDGDKGWRSLDELRIFECSVCTCTDISILINNTKANFLELFANNSYEVSVNISMDCGGGDTPPDSYWFDCVFAGIRWTEQKKIFDSSILILLNEATYRIKCEVKDSNYSLCFGSTFAKIVMPGSSSELRCDENCASKVNVAKRMVVTWHCEAPWCKNVRPDWSLYKVDTGGTTILVSKKIIYSGIDSAILKENSLEENTTYKILATSSPPGSDFKDISRMEFRTNSKPYVAQRQGGCTVSPMEGIALNTLFFFSCVGWLDQDKPLTYIFKFRISYGDVPFYKGLASNTSAMMPLGDSKNNFNLVVVMVVQDALGASDTIVKTLNVSKSESLSVDEVDGLLNTTDEKRLQKCILILSAVDGANSSSKEKIQVKEKVLKGIMNVTIQTLEEVGTLASIVNMATEDEEQVSPTIQDKSLTKLDDMVAFTSQWKNRSDDAELLKEVGHNVLHCISNVMTVATNNVLKNSSDKGISNTKASLELTDRMGTVLLETTILGEPASFKTKYFGMLVGKHRRSHQRVQIAEDIFLPGATDLFSNTSESLSTFGSQLINYPKNPYDWDTSSKNITSSVVDFTLKTDEGTTIDVKGLKNPVELYIPRDDNATNTSQPTNFFVKPSEDEAISQFHSISIPSDDVSLSLTITPSGDRSLVVYVSAEERPTPSNYNFMTEVPNITFCQNYQVSNCSREAYTFSISSAITGTTGQHYVGIRLVKTSESVREQSEQLTLHLRSRRDSGSGNGGLKNCILTKAPPPTPVPPTIRPVYDASTDVNYTMSVNVASCKYWSNKTNTWTSEGCKAGLESVSDKIQCFCTHLSAFGGGFFVTPNPIDFDVVAHGIGNNYSVLATVCTIFALYFLCLIYARRADKKDRAKIIADVVVARDFSDSYQYQIYIRTGIWRRYGTSAVVGIVLYGENGCTDNIYLTDSKIQRKFFARASVNHFTLYLPESLGQLYKIKLWHDNTGNNSSWFVEDVCIVDSQTTDEWHFIARQWLAVDKGGGKLKVELQVTDEEQLKAVGNLTYTRAAKSFADTHLWFSIFTKPPHNKFTRCQRLSCCLSTLFAAMIANAMFYKLGGSAEDTFKVGPLEVSWTQIKIGIQSSLVAVPVNVLLVLIFRYVKESKRYLNEEPTADKKTQDGCLPHFFVYIAWLLCLAAAVTSAVFTVFYSIQWGKEKSNQWLTSVFVSFFDDILVLQPLKIVLLASLVSMIIRKLPKKEQIVGPSLWRRRKAHEISTSGVRKASLAFEERDHKRKLLKMHSKFKEITTFLVFVILLMIVCYGNRSDTRYMVTRSLEETFGEFKDVGEPPEFWNWTRDTLVPGLYDSTWYNGRPFDPKEGYISTRESFMIGMPRLRQIRVKSERECKNVGNYLVLQEMFERCLPLDMADDEDTTSQLPGWIPAPHNFQDSSLYFQEVCPKPWKYLTAKELQTTSFYGQTYSYGGGGYVADLGYTSTSANDVIDILEKNVWIDDRTAGVFVEFAVFEPSTSLITSVKYLYERLATGQTNTVRKMKTLTLYSPADPGLRSIYEVCQLIFILVICFMLFAQIVKLIHAQAAYFKHFWNWVELIEIASASSSLAMFFLKQKFTSTFVKNVQANPFKTTSADYLVLWSELEVALLSFVIFTVTIKFLRIIRFNRHVCQMMATLKRSSKPLVSFSAVFITALLGFSHLGYLVFGRSLEAYSTFGGTLASMLTMTLGDQMYYHEISSISSVIGPSFLFVYMVIIGCILVSLFVTIMIDTYSDARKSVLGDEDFSDADLGDFMADYIKKRIKGLQRNIILWWKERSRKKEAETARRRSSGGLVKLNAVRKKTLRGGRFQVEDFENVELITVETEYATEVKHSGSPSTFMDSLSDINLSTWHSILLMYAEEEIADDLFVEEIVQCLSNHKNLSIKQLIDR